MDRLVSRRLSVARGLDPTGRLSGTADRASVRPAESRAGLDRSVGGRGRGLGLVVSIDSNVGDDGLVDGLGCSAGTRSLASGSAGGKSGSGDLDRGGSRVESFTAGCHGLVASGQVGDGEPGAEEGSLAVGHDGS